MTTKSSNLLNLVHTHSIKSKNPKEARKKSHNFSIKNFQLKFQINLSSRTTIQMKQEKCRQLQKPFPQFSESSVSGKKTNFFIYGKLPHIKMLKRNFLTRQTGIKTTNSLIVRCCCFQL